MNRILPLAITLLLPLAIIAEEPVAVVKTTQATIFLNGAQLQQQASIRLQKGQNEIRLEGLSHQLKKQSLQVTLTNNAIVTAMEYSLDYLTLPAQSQRVKNLQDSVAAAERQVSLTDNALTTNSQLQSLLEKGVSHTLQLSNQPLTTDAIERQLTYYGQRQSSLQTEQRSLEKKKEQQQKRLDALREQLNQETKHSRQRSGILTLTVQSAATQTVTAQVRYFTPAAHWTPFYDMKVTEVGQPVTLTLKAQVAQTTGMDWQQIPLTLSTGTPSTNNSLPQWQPWRLKEPQPVAKRYVEKKAKSYSMAYEPLLMSTGAVDTAEEEDDSEMNIADYIEQTEQTLSAEYAIRLPYTLTGNGKEQTVTLKEQQVEEVDYCYHSLPKTDKNVYLAIALNHWEKLNLLNGVANLYNGNTYLGQTALNTASTDDALRLSLGDEKQITVQRELISEQSHRKTVGQTRQVTQTYRLTVRNNKRQKVHLSLQEPYPISATNEITVTLNDNTTRCTENNKDKGLLTYLFELQAGESKEIIVSFTVKYPKDWTINL